MKLPLAVDLTFLLGIIYLNIKFAKSVQSSEFALATNIHGAFHVHDNIDFAHVKYDSLSEILSEHNFSCDI